MSSAAPMLLLMQGYPRHIAQGYGTAELLLITSLSLLLIQYYFGVNVSTTLFTVWKTNILQGPTVFRFYSNTTKSMQQQFEKLM